MKPILRYLSVRFCQLLPLGLLSICLLLAITWQATAALPPSDTMQVRAGLEEVFIDPIYYRVLEDSAGTLNSCVATRWLRIWSTRARRTGSDSLCAQKDHWRNIGT
jgi:hypothetical protein